MSGPGTPTRFYRSDIPPTPPPPPPKSAVLDSGSRPLASSSVTPSIHAQEFGEDQNEFNQSIGSSISLVEAGWLPQALEDKSIQDLRHLLEQPDLQSAMLNNPETSHPSVTASQAPLKRLLQSNLELATAVNNLEERLMAQRKYTESHLLALRALEQQHRTKIGDTEHLLQDFSPMALYRRLNAGIQEQDNLLKTTEESYLEQNGIASEQDISAFLRHVREIKRTAFLRNERRKRWDEGRVGGWR